MRLLPLLAIACASCGFGDNVTEPPGPTPAACGDGVVDAGETCDDGDTVDGDGCSAACTAELLRISEYVEGTSNNKAIEIHNPQPRALDLTAAGCELRLYSNGSPAATSIALLEGTLAADGVLVVCHPGSEPDLLALCDATSLAANFNGNDAVALACGGAIVDVFGQIGVDPITPWSGGGMSAVDATLRRGCASAPDADGADPFDLTGWVADPIDAFDDLGTPTCAPSS